MDKTMKYVLTVVAVASVAALAVSCGNKKRAEPMAPVEVYSDSL